MPPKSKKSLAFWQKCEECLCILSTKDILNHHEFCQKPKSEWTCGYIEQNTLHGFLEDVKNKGISPSEGSKEFLKTDQAKSLVFLSQSAIQLCGLCIGFPVIVELCGYITVMHVWPSFDGSLTSVMLDKEELELISGMELKSTNIRVSKLLSKPVIAKEVCFHFLIDQKESTDWDEVCKILPFIFKNRVIFTGMHLIVPFYGKKIRLKISNIAAHNFDLTSTFDKLSITDLYYLTTESTMWINENTLNRKAENKDVQQKVIGGYSTILAELAQNISYTFSDKRLSEGYSSFCVLLYGSSGTGKTTIAKYLAFNSGKDVINIQGTDLYSKFYGETETRLRHCFQEAKKKAPCVVVIDNIEVLASRKGTDQERRVLSSILSLFDSIQSSPIVVIATTVDPDLLDPSLRRPGRLESEVEINIPDKNERYEILKALVLEPKLDSAIRSLSLSCHGYVGADLAALVDKAITRAALNSASSLEEEHLQWAFTQVRPSAMRQLQVHVPSVRWSDIGGGKNVRLRLEQAVEWPLRYAENLKRLGIKAPKGVLLYGPPGCSKTLVVKALATETNLNFISIKGSDVFSKWVGESEKAIRDLFRCARKVAPSIVFLDEVDALGASRGTSTGTTVHDRVLSQLLTEMDGVNPLDGVVVIAATNRPDCIDKALLRPGRLDRIIYVPLPDYETRLQIFEIQLKKIPTDDVNIEELATKTDGYSGAEIVAVCTEAALAALQEDITAAKVSMTHFEIALSSITPRTPQSLLNLYDEYKSQKER